MAAAIVLFLVGLVLIVKGGDYFVDSATWMAEVSGIPKFVIGATVVSLATTLPEIIVSITAALEGKVDMAIGNAIGSVTANTGLIMSIGVFFMAVAVSRKQFMKKAMLLIAVICCLWVASMDGDVKAAEGIIFLIMFALFIYLNIQEARNCDEDTEMAVSKDKRSIIINLIKFAAGAAGIVIGSDLLVDKGSLIASYMGVPESVIALTAVAIGTSLPELVTTVTAIIKKESAISIGNIVGANIIDMALILPACALVSGGSIPVEAQTIRLDMPVCLGVSLVMLIPALVKEKFLKWQSVVALCIYIAYLVVVCI